MSEIWRTASMEGKWKNGKGQVVLSIEQAEDFVNALNVAIEKAKEEMEQKQRSEGNEQDNN